MNYKLTFGINNKGRLSVLFISLFLFIITSCGTGADSNEKIAYPVSKNETVTDTFHNIAVSESYRWLENFDDPAVKQWSREQNELTRSILDKVTYREQIKERLGELLGGDNIYYYDLKYINNLLFAMKKQPPLEQSLLVVMASPDDPSTERVVVNVNQLDTAGTTSIDFYVSSHDASLVAVSMSEFGSEKGTVYVFDVKTGKKLDDVVPDVNGPTAGGDVAWTADNKGFFYTRYPHQGERPDEDLSFYQQVYYHKLGTPYEKDKYEIGEKFPRIAEIQLDASKDANLFIATVANGDGGEYSHYLRNKKGQWTQITKDQDLIPQTYFGEDNSIYLLSHKDAPKGRVLKLEQGESDLTKAKVVVEESFVSIREVLPMGDLIYMVDIDGGPLNLRVVDKIGAIIYQSPVGQISSIGSLTPYGDKILMNITSYTEPSAWYQFDPKTKELTRTALFRTSPVNFDDIEVVRKFATSLDGTKVPINIMMKKGTELNGKNPAILYGYGGYGICLTPYFNPELRLWFDQGGIYVIANIRGGGEFGEEWHWAGNLEKKQNVFDDFAACAKYMIDEKYTNPDKFVIQGGSNGGLLMGATVTQHPELFAAVVCHVGVLDMLRVELDPNGEFNVTEFGTVKNPIHFKALLDYSPYHNVKENTMYPAMMLLTGEHDGRVDPYHSRKMAAAMQAATISDKPILYRSSSTSGHGGGTALSEQIDKQADVYSFIFSQLNLNYKYDK